MKTYPVLGTDIILSEQEYQSLVKAYGEEKVKEHILKSKHPRKERKEYNELVKIYGHDAARAFALTIV